MLKLDNVEDIEGQSGGSLRSLDIDREPAFVGGIPLGTAQGQQLRNVSRIAANLGLPSAKGFRGCVRMFKLGHREVKIQSLLDPMVMRRVGVSECPGPYESLTQAGLVPKGMTSTQSTPSPLLAPSHSAYPGEFPAGTSTVHSAFVPAFHPGGAADVPTSGGRGQSMVHPTLYGPPGWQQPQSMEHPFHQSSASTPSFLELPTLKHVSKAFHIEVWFMTHSSGKGFVT